MKKAITEIQVTLAKDSFGQLRAQGKASQRRRALILETTTFGNIIKSNGTRKGGNVKEDRKNNCRAIVHDKSNSASLSVANCYWGSFVNAKNDVALHKWWRVLSLHHIYK